MFYLLYEILMLYGLVSAEAYTVMPPLSVLQGVAPVLRRSVLNAALYLKHTILKHTICPAGGFGLLLGESG